VAVITARRLAARPSLAFASVLQPFGRRTFGFLLWNAPVFGAVYQLNLMLAGFSQDQANVAGVAVGA
jgi:hypothetical protein